MVHGKPSGTRRFPAYRAAATLSYQLPFILFKGEPVKAPQVVPHVVGLILRGLSITTRLLLLSEFLGVLRAISPVSFIIAGLAPGVPILAVF